MRELDEFFELLRFPSVSADPAHAGDVRACAAWLSEWLGAAGMEVRLAECGGPPVVTGSAGLRPGVPRLLVYGHYDVQPAAAEPAWLSPPFEPEVRDGLVHARGATDNKGQMFSLLLGIRSLLRAGVPPAGLLVVLEGEEETGSPHFASFLDRHRAELGCEAVLICDTSMVAPGWPALTNGLRGIACFEVAVHGPRTDLHSGIFGGAVRNPAMVLSRILARLEDVGGGVGIPGFADGVIEPSAEERRGWAELPWDADWFRAATGVEASGGERSLPVLERVWARPTAEINGIFSGHTGAGSKTVIPSVARAKLSFRLAPGQDPGSVAGMVADWFNGQFAFEGVRGEVVFDHGGEPFHVPPGDPMLGRAAAALEEVFGRRPTLTREGLSIPAASMLGRALGVPVLLAGLGLPDCRAHGPDESFPVAHLDLGARLLRALAGRMG